MEKHFTIECDCKSTLVRLLSKQRAQSERLNNIEDSISKIFDLFDKLDDIGDIAVALRENAIKLQQLAPETNQQEET